MKFSPLILSLAAVALVPTAAQAEDKQDKAEVQAENEREAFIAFADQGGVRDWRSEGREFVYFKDRRGDWYKAELFSPSFELPFAQTIGLDTKPGGRLDKWSSVVIDGQRYALKSFERVDGPPAKKKADEDDA